MSEVQTDSYAHNRNMAKILKDEQELEVLLKGGAPEEDNDVEDTSDLQQETTEDATREERVVKAEKSKPSEGEEEDLSAEEKNFKKRYGDLRRHTQEKEKEWSDRLEKLENQLHKATKNELVLPKTKDDIAAWSAKYPDIAGIVEAIADQKAQERSADINERLKEIDSMKAEAIKQKAEAFMLKKHPDFFEIKEDNAFHEWAALQPKSLQKALYEDPDNVEEVSWAIDMYKTAKGIKNKTSSSSDKAAASSVKTRGRTAVEQDHNATKWSESKVAKLSDKDFEKYYPDIQEAQRSSNFIYDMSKK